MRGLKVRIRAVVHHDPLLVRCPVPLHSPHAPHPASRTPSALGWRDLGLSSKKQPGGAITTNGGSMPHISPADVNLKIGNDQVPDPMTQIIDVLCDWPPARQKLKRGPCPNIKDGSFRNPTVLSHPTNWAGSPLTYSPI